MQGDTFEGFKENDGLSPVRRPPSVFFLRGVLARHPRICMVLAESSLSNSKQTIMTRPTLDFLIPVTANISDPAPSEDKPAKSSGPSRRTTAGPSSASDGPSRKRSTGVKHEYEQGYDEQPYSAHEYGQDGRYGYGTQYAAQQAQHIPPEHYQEIQAGQPYHLPHLHQQHHQSQHHQQYNGGYDRSPVHSASPYSAQPQSQGYQLPHLHPSPSHNGAHGSSSSHNHTATHMHSHAQVGHGSVNPQILPNIDTWKKDASGGGGTGEGGRGMFDDYEDDDEDY